MDPRIGKADYGERYRKLYQTELSDNSNNHESNNASRHIHGTPDTICNKINHLNEQNGERKPRNYKLISDPALQHGVKKVYSINGVIPGTNEVVVVRDPRHRSSKFYFKKEPTDLPVPMFKHDQHSVSTVLPKEVTFLNLNNNIDKSFLMNHCSPFGMIDNVTIYYHPITKKHLGIGSVLFSSTKAAKLCCEKLHNTSVMGNIMNVFVDISGAERKRVIEEITIQKSSKIPKINTGATPFKSPTQNKLHKIASQGNIVELSNLQNKSDSSSSLQLLHADGNSATTQNGVSTVDLPTPSYSDLGYFSSRQSDASEHVLSSGGESVGSGNSSIILPADPRLSRSKDNARVVNDSPIGSDEFLPSTLNFNNLNSPFTPDQSRPTKIDPSAPILPRFSKIRNSVSVLNHSSPLPTVELEADQVQNRDPRLTRSKDNHTNCVKVDQTAMPNVASRHSFSDLNTFINQYHDNSASINEEEINISCKSACETFEDKQDALSISLDTRIEAMLNQEASFGIPRASSFSLAPILDEAFGQPEGIVGPTNEQQTDDCQNKDGTGDDDDDDRMSMSSCDEPKNDLIEVNVPAKYPQVSKPPPPLITQWPLFQFQFQVGIPMMPTFMPSYPRFYNMFDVPDIPLPVQEDETSGKFRKVLGSVVAELKTVLSKDLRRKMVESTAFEVFDEWWNKNDLLDKKCGSDLFSQKSSNVPNRSSAHSMNNDGSSMLSFLFEGQDSQNRMGFGSGGLLGLRGIAAKLPSFRKKYRAPTPPPEETGDNEDHRITCASDSESDEESKENLPGISEEDLVDRDSVVRFRSGSHHESSGSDESSSDEEEIDDVHVRKSRIRKSQLILSDSGEDDDDDESGSESGGTAMASDESDDDLPDKLEDDGHKIALDETKEFLEHKRESLKRRHDFFGSSEDDSDEGMFSKKLRHETSEESLTDANIDQIFDEGSINDSKKRKRQIYEGKASNEKPSKVKRLEIDDSSSPILAVPTSESHTSCRLFFPSQSPSGPSHPKVFRAENLPNNLSQNIKLSDVTNRISVESKSPQRLKPSRELQRLHCSFSSQPKQTLKHDIKFQPRDYEMEAKIVHSFLNSGIDVEDIAYLKESYEQLILADYPQTNWLNETHWFDHPSTHTPPHAPTARNKKKRSAEEFETRHKTGSARTEGYYKISLNEKLRYLKSAMGVQNHMLVTNPNEADSNLAAITGMKKKVQQQSRDARSESRRWQSFFSSIGEDLGDLLKFNQLKFRKKQLKFAKSGIHDWGLFALERIQEGEMVIEYVGQVIRQSMADIREKRYESTGIGSSYLFRIDGDTIVDATKYGNLARFINHSCTPNCCAKIVTVESQKKIVIYSRRDIEANEEITYDYKFPLEDQKIPCLCGSSGCRGSLN